MSCTLPLFELVVVSLALSSCASYAPVKLNPILSSDMVATDPDDPAIWIDQQDPGRSLILGTNKASVPEGALVIFGIDGHMVQTIDGMARPNNVDVEYGFELAGRAVDIVVVTEREERRLRVFSVSAEGVEDISSSNGLEVFSGEQGARSEPMGIALYRNPESHAIYAVLSRKAGPTAGYLWQYRLEDDGTGKVRATKVRELGTFSGKGEIEAIAVDDELGYIYFADEEFGIHKWYADPYQKGASEELAVFGKLGFEGDREGIAILSTGEGRGYILCTDQISGNSSIMVYAREGTKDNPHDHDEMLKRIRVATDETDGLEATGVSLPGFPHGLVVVMDNAGMNYRLFSWEDFARAQSPELELF